MRWPVPNAATSLPCASTGCDARARLRRVGLSATVAHPDAIAAYVGATRRIEVGGRRAAGTDR